MSLDNNGVSEVFNDIDGELTNFYRVLQSEVLFEQLIKMCELTPFSEIEFQAAKLHTLYGSFGESVIKAWKFFVRNRMSRGGSGKDFATPTSRLRRGINENVSAYLGALDSLPEFHKRLRYAEVRKMDFRDFLSQYDHEDAFFYVDPPYLKSTRVAGEYDYEMDGNDHLNLLDILSKLNGKFMLSTYDNLMYSSTAVFQGWQKATFEVSKSSSSSKTKPKAVETIYMNY